MRPKGVYARTKSWVRPRCQAHSRLKLQDDGCLRCETDQCLREIWQRLLARTLAEKGGCRNTRRSA